MNLLEVSAFVVTSPQLLSQVPARNAFLYFPPWIGMQTLFRQHIDMFCTSVTGVLL